MKAAVMRGTNQPLTVEEVVVADPGPREVRLRTVASGVCHSDLHAIDGTLPGTPTPTVLGHEPAGIVLQVGSQVTDFAPGDHVIACLSVFCGNCEYCHTGRPNLCGGRSTARGPDEPPRLATPQGEPVYQFAHLSSYAEEMLVHENALVKIRDEMPLDRAALIGCGVTTGLGAALNTARIRPGESAMILGCGGVGLSALQGCRIASAGRIVAVDTQPWKLELAQKLGATDVVDASEGDVAARVRELTGGGVDFAFECLGTKATVAETYGAVRTGGTCVMVGVVPAGENVEFPGLDVVISGKTIMGSMMGGNRFRVDMPRFVDFYLSGKLNLDDMISDRLPLSDINTAFDKMRDGSAARSVITF